MIDELTELLGPPDRVFKSGGTWWADVTPEALEKVKELPEDRRLCIRAVYAYKSGDEQRYNIGWAEDWLAWLPGGGAHDLARMLLAGPDLPVVDSEGKELTMAVQATMLTARQRARAERIARNEDEGSYAKRERMELRGMAPQQVVVVK